MFVWEVNNGVDCFTKYKKELQRLEESLKSAHSLLNHCTKILNSQEERIGLLEDMVQTLVDKVGFPFRGL